MAIDNSGIGFSAGVKVGVGLGVGANANVSVKGSRAIGGLRIRAQCRQIVGDLGLLVVFAALRVDGVDSVTLRAVGFQVSGDRGRDLL